MEDDEGLLTRWPRGTGPVPGRALDPLPGRAWMTVAVRLVGHVPLSLLDRVCGGRLARATWALSRWESRVVYDKTLPPYRKPQRG